MDVIAFGTKGHFVRNGDIGHSFFYHNIDVPIFKIVQRPYLVYHQYQIKRIFALHTMAKGLCPFRRSVWASDTFLVPSAPDLPITERSDSRGQ